MTKQVINVSGESGVGTTDSRRIAYPKINDNFTELYSGKFPGPLYIYGDSIDDLDAGNGAFAFTNEDNTGTAYPGWNVIRVSGDYGPGIAIDSVLRVENEFVGPYLYFFTRRGAFGSPASTVAGDELGTISWSGYGATGWDSSTVRIRVTVAAGTTGNNVRKQLEFLTSHDPGAYAAAISYDGCLMVGPTMTSLGGGSINALVLGANGVKQNFAYTVATLPVASTCAYSRTFITDSNSTTFNNVVAGGGANRIPVWSDGTNWRIG